MAYKRRIKNIVYSPCKPHKWGMKFCTHAESQFIYVFNLRIVGERLSIGDTVIELVKNLEGCHRTHFVDNYYNLFRHSDLLYMNVYSYTEL